MSQLFRLKNGTVLLSTEAPGGIYNSGQLKKIAELCSKELAIVKATEDQRLALFVKESEVENVAKQLRAIGLGFRHYQDSLHQPVSCLGELCEEHEQPAMATAMDITKEIASIQLDTPLKIGINGCARCCTPCHTLDIAVVGDVSGYRISLGGKTRQMPEFASYFAEGVPPKELPKRLKAVIETYKRLAEADETLHDVIERCGVAEFVQALAPYSQDAAQREDPFAKENASESLDDLSVETDDTAPEAELGAGLEADDELSFEEEAAIADLDGDLTVDDDLNIVDDQLDDQNIALDEIPIEKASQGSLEDDLSLGQDDESSAMIDMDFSDESSNSSLATDDESMLDDKNLELEDAPELGEDFRLHAVSEIPEDDIDLDGPELAADESVEAMTESADLAGDEPLTLDEGISDDLGEEVMDDSDLSLAETPLDEDLEGIPELDEDLVIEDLPTPPVQAKAPAPKPVPAPAPAALTDDFGEELPADVPDLSDEEESEFEQKLQASIDEESALMAKAEKDPNVGDRQAALSLLENTESLDDDLDAIDLNDASLDDAMNVEDELEEINDDSLELTADDEMEEIGGQDAMESAAADEVLSGVDLDLVEDLEILDEELEPINEPMEEFPEPGPRELAQIKSRPAEPKLSGSSKRPQFKISAITFQDEHMRVTFDTSAYVDFDLSALGLGEERSFRLGVQNVAVTSTGEGYILEFDGMRLFHPKTSLPVAS